MQKQDQWQEWFEQNRDLLILLNTYELTPEAVIAARDRLFTEGKDVDMKLFANIVELAVAREARYWRQLKK